MQDRLAGSYTGRARGETRTRVQLSEGLSRGLGVVVSGWMDGEIEITHCDHNLQSSEPEQLSGLRLHFNHLQAPYTYMYEYILHIQYIHLYILYVCVECEIR